MGGALPAQDPMHTLLYTREFPPYAGGAATYVYDLATGLRDISQDVSVLAPIYGNGDRDVDGSAAFPIVRQTRRELDVTEEAAALRRFLQDGKFDVVLICDYRAQEAAAQLDWSALPPYVIVVHGTEMARHFGTSRAGGADYRRLLERFFRRAGAVIAVSRSTQELIARHLPDIAPTVRVVHSGVNPDLFPMLSAEETHRRRAELDLTEDRVLLCAARLAPGKGHDVLLKALGWINEALGNVSLLIAGDGPCADDVRRLAAALGVRSRVMFLGAVERAALHRYLAVCDLFVMTSRRGRRESFGLVFLEANCCGRPVLAGRTGGVPEAVEDGITGALVEPTDPNTVAVAAIDLLQDPDTLHTLGTQGRERVLSRFTHTHMAEDTAHVCHDAI